MDSPLSAFKLPPILLVLAILAGCASPWKHTDAYLDSTSAAKNPHCPGPLDTWCKPVTGDPWCCPDEQVCRPGGCAYNGNPGGIFGSSADGGAAKLMPGTPER